MDFSELASNDNTRVLCRVLETAAIKIDPAIAITLDAEKAFDRVSWAFLKQCMYTFNLGEPYIKMVMSLYLTPLARIAVNGSLSEPLTLQQGTRQGCPLSPSLFLLA